MVTTDSVPSSGALASDPKQTRHHDTNIPTMAPLFGNTPE